MSQALVRQVLATAAHGCWSALDLGSGEGTFRPPTPIWHTVDGCAKAPSDGHITGPLLEVLPTLTRAYDLVYALDVIEHLPKTDGFILLDHMARLARRRVLVFTPNGFMPQESPNKWMIHRSGWDAEEFRARGYLTGITDFDYGQGKGMQPHCALWAVLDK